MASDDKSKRFDCIKFMREVRARINETIKDMSSEELHAWLVAGPL